MRFLPVVFVPAEVDAGAALSFSAAEAGTLQIVSAVLEVRAEFLLQLCVAIRTQEENDNWNRLVTAITAALSAQPGGV